MPFNDVSFSELKFNFVFFVSVIVFGLNFSLCVAV